MDFFQIGITLIAVIIAITIHEFAHAAAAVSCGDDTPKKQGRISLNPLDHFDPVGFTMIVLTSIFGFGIGWGKPVMIDPANFRNPRWDDIKVAAWGPLSNILQAIVFSVVWRFWALKLSYGVQTFVLMMVLVNIGLALFNLIPLPPLDGSHILAGLLPREAARKYVRFAAQYGMAALLLCIMVPVGGHSLISWVISPASSRLVHLLLR